MTCEINVNDDVMTKALKKPTPYEKQVQPRIHSTADYQHYKHKTRK